MFFVMISCVWMWEKAKFFLTHISVSALVVQHEWKGTGTEVVVHYTYAVNGKTYTGSSNVYGEEVRHRGRRGGGLVNMMWGPKKKSAHAITHDYPVGSTFSLYVDKKNPHNTAFNK